MHARYARPAIARVVTRQPADDEPIEDEPVADEPASPIIETRKND